MNVKQVIVIRKDLNMRKGKIAAQASHASMKVILDMMDISEAISPTHMLQVRTLTIAEGTALDEWLNGIFTKVCLYVNSEEELIDIYNKASEVNLPCTIIEDVGLTEFKGVKTKTCIAIGPAHSEQIDEITGHLNLL